jgi:hypothetical protein
MTQPRPDRSVVHWPVQQTGDYGQQRMRPSKAACPMVHVNHRQPVF